MLAHDTIVALSSGNLPSGIAVVRISGPAAAPALERLAGGVPEPRRASLRRVRDGQGETIDRGLALFFPGPDTATGEDVAELHLHGGRAVVSAVLAALTALPGVRLAEAGEFTRRAFESGRIDLTEAEGLADLLAAETEGQRRQAAGEAGGLLRALYEGWMARLTRVRALVEAAFDFSDEGDVPETVAENVAAEVVALAEAIRAHLAGARQGEIRREGFRVAIVGAPNAGKSSLLNALLRREAAIVSDVPGTTRDVLEATLDLGGLPVRFADTAGLRETTDKVEAIGVERAKAAAQGADLVLLLFDPLDEQMNMRRNNISFAGLLRLDDMFQEGAPALRVATKRDGWSDEIVPSSVETADLAVSSQTGEGLDALAERIAAMAQVAAGDPATLVPTRTRQRTILAEALVILDGYDPVREPPEVAAETLRRAADRLGALTGRVGVEDLLDVVFGQFCVGK